MSPIEHELHAHASALRALARDLVGDQHADDLLQDTAVQALQRGPRRPGPFGGWLATVVRRLASKHRRGERRRRARERAVAKPEALAPACELADREVFRRVNDAVLALPEPYQSTVLQRYLRELPVAVIAQQGGLPVATVKTRLQRGLALLRERLERDGRDWRAMLAAAFGLERALPLAATLSTGVMMMGSGVKFALGAVAAAGAVAMLCWLQEPAPTASPLASGPQLAPMLAQAPRAEPDAAPERRELPPPPVTAAALATLHGRCVDTLGRPLEGVAVQARSIAGNTARLAEWQQLHGAWRWPAPADGVSAVDGSFRLEVAPSGPGIGEFTAMAAGRAAARASWPEFPAGDVDLGDVVLRRQVSVQVRAVDGQHRPVADTGLTFQLLATEAELATPPLRLTRRTDRDGRLQLLLGEGDYGVFSARPGDHGLRLPVPGDRPGFDAELQFGGAAVLASIEGDITAPDGRPVADVLIKAGETPEAIRYRVRSDDDGHFVVGRAAGDSDAPQFLHCWCDGFDDYHATEAVAFGTHDVQLVLQPACAVRLCVRTSDGAPVEAFTALLRRAADEVGGVQIGGRHPRGELLFDPLSRGSYRLSVDAADAALAGRYDLEVEVAGAGPVRLDVVLPRRAERTLKVITSDGAAVAGASFEVLAPQRRRRPDLDTGAVPFTDWRNVGGPNLSVLLQQGSTDVRGEAILRGPPDQLVCVRLPGGPALPGIVDDVSLAKRAPLLVTVARGATLAGRLGPPELLARLRQATGWDYPPSWPDGTSNLHLSLQCGAASPSREVAVDADGRFCTEGLPPGPCTVMLVAFCNGIGQGGVQRQLASLDLADGAAVERDFLLPQLVPAHLAGRVVLDGAATAADELRLQPQRGAGNFDHDFHAVLAADGSFSLWLSPGTYRVSLRTQGGHGDGIVLQDPLVIAPGATLTPRFSARLGLLRARLVDAEGQPASAEVWIGDRDGSWRGTCATDGDGRISMPLETGSYSLAIWPPELRDPAARERFAEQHGGRGALEARRRPLATLVVGGSDPAWQVVVVPDAR